MLTVLMGSTVHAACVAAAERPAPLYPTLPTLPASYHAIDLPPRAEFPPNEFRPRGHSLLDKDLAIGAPDEAPMMPGTTMWQRLADFRTHGRVRVVTLWETGGSSVSLQAGKRGDPSLQWTSRSLNRGGATRGLLDGWLTASFSGAGKGLHFGQHRPGEAAAGKTMPRLDTPAFGGAGPVK